MYQNIKYDKLDANSFDSDEPLLNPDNVKLELYANDNVDIDVNEDENVKMNQTYQHPQTYQQTQTYQQPQQQQINDNTSRCIMRMHIANIIVFSSCLTILISGFIDLKKFNENEIIYTNDGYRLYSNYYYVNFIWYFIYLSISIYLIIYALFYNCCRVIRDQTYFRMVKINYIILSLNIVTKLIYGFILLMLTYHGEQIQINSMPKYYNLIIIESLLYFMFSLHVNNLINVIV